MRIFRFSKKYGAYYILTNYGSILLFCSDVDPDKVSKYLDVSVDTDLIHAC